MGKALKKRHAKRKGKRMSKASIKRKVHAIKKKLKHTGNVKKMMKLYAKIKAVKKGVSVHSLYKRKKDKKAAAKKKALKKKAKAKKHVLLVKEAGAKKIARAKRMAKIAKRASKLKIKRAITALRRKAKRKSAKLK